MEQLIKETLSRTICTGWDRGFLESILEQLDKGRQLSTKQRDMLEQVMDRNDEDSQIAHRYDPFLDNGDFQLF